MIRFVLLPICLTILMRTQCSLGKQVTNIRLWNGTNPSARIGRIEIQINNNTWGSVCDDGWGENDAFVACRMLGFTNGGTAVTDTRFGSGNASFLLDDTACTGDEPSLSECPSSQATDCSRPADTDAGVICNENSVPGQPTVTPAPVSTGSPSVISGICQPGVTPTVRLFGRQGVDGSGFVEVQMPNGTWGFVCDDGWSLTAAAIVCGQLCYPTSYTAKPGIPAEYVQNPQNPNIVLDNVNCFGNESKLQDCQHAPWGIEDCLTTAGELAGVQCVAAPYLPPPAPVAALLCGDGKIKAQFPKANGSSLEAKHISVFSQPNCPDTVKDANATYVSITIPVDKCNTTVTRNGTHIIYSNEILYDSTSQIDGYTYENTYRIGISCVFPVGVDVTQRVEPLTQAVTQSSVGIFHAYMVIYRNDSFTIPATENPVLIPLGEYLNVVVGMEEYDPNLKLVVTDCIATPTGDDQADPKKYLFKDKCSQEPSLSFYPLSNFRVGFRFKPFKFVGFDIVYLHCSGIICLASDNSQECDRTCSNNKLNGTSSSSGRRKKRSAGPYSFNASSQAILIYDPYAAGSDLGSYYDTKNSNTTTGVPVTVQSTTVQTTTVQITSLQTTSLQTTSLQTTSLQTTTVQTTIQQKKSTAPTLKQEGPITTQTVEKVASTEYHPQEFKQMVIQQIKNIGEQDNDAAAEGISLNTLLLVAVLLSCLRFL